MAIVLIVGIAIIEIMKSLVGIMDLQFNLGYPDLEFEWYVIILLLISPLIVQPKEVLCCMEEFRSTFGGSLSKLMKQKS